MRSAHSHHCSLTVIVACSKPLSSSARGSTKCFPRQPLVVVTSLVTACLGSALVHSNSNSSSSTPPRMLQRLRLAQFNHVPLAHRRRPPSVAVGVLRVSQAMVAAGEWDKVTMNPADRAVCDSNTAHGIGRSNRWRLIINLLKGASPRGVGLWPAPRGGGAQMLAAGGLAAHTQTIITTGVSVLRCTNRSELRLDFSHVPR